MSPSVSVRLLLTQSDACLVAFARAGHERAFEALVQRYRRPLLGYCRRLLLSDERAEDALQQALLQAWLALRAGTEVGDIKPWLYRIVHNAALNALRISGYDYCKLSESLSGADAPQEDLDRRIAVREALAGLAALPEMQREALLRTAVEGRTHQQVARDLGLSENALRGLVYRARAALRATAGAIVPPPLVSWALGSGARGTPAIERLAELGAGSGSAGVAGLLMKGGAVAVTAGVLAGGIAAVHVPAQVSHRHSTARTALRPARPATASLALSAARSASMTPVAGAQQTVALRTPSHGQRRSPTSRPAPWPRRVAPRPSTIPSTTTTATAPLPSPAPASIHGPDHGTGGRGGDPNEAQPPDPNGPGSGAGSGATATPSGDGGHGAPNPEQGSDGSSSTDGTSGTPSGEGAGGGSSGGVQDSSVQDGGGHGIRGSGSGSGSSTTGPPTSQPEGSRDHQSYQTVSRPEG